MDLRWSCRSLKSVGDRWKCPSVLWTYHESFTLQTNIHWTVTKFPVYYFYFLNYDFNKTKNIHNLYSTNNYTILCDKCSENYHQLIINLQITVRLLKTTLYSSGSLWKSVSLRNYLLWRIKLAGRPLSSITNVLPVKQTMSGADSASAEVVETICVKCLRTRSQYIPWVSVCTLFYI